jgi:2-dehydropantoate 2-reductase
VSEPRIAVVGAGASGAAVASDLVRAGREVTLVEQWPAHVEAMRAHGLTVGLRDGSSTATEVDVVHVCQVAELRAIFDIVFLAVKAFDTRWSVQLIAPRLAAGGVVVGLQNGMTAGDIASIVGPERTLGAVVEIASAIAEPGVIARATGPDGTWYGLGSPDGASAAKAPAVAEVLSAAGEVEVFDDIGSAKWMKLVGNAAEFLPSGILDLPLLDALHIPAIRELADAAGREALDVGLALGHRIVPLFGDAEMAAHGPESYAAAILDAILTGWSPPAFKVALLQDWVKGRRGEGEDINGLVVSEGRRLGLPTPVNDVLVDFSRRVERGELSIGLPNVEPLIAAAGEARTRAAA